MDGSAIRVRAEWHFHPTGPSVTPSFKVVYIDLVSYRILVGQARILPVSLSPGFRTLGF